MGRIFLEHMDGEYLYHCIVCTTNLTSLENIVYTRFVANFCTAVVFKKVINVVLAESLKSQLLTGQYYIRSVFCKKCGAKLGWFYEYSCEETQSCREGLTVLENKAIVMLNAKGRLIGGY